MSKAKQDEIKHQFSMLNDTEYALLESLVDSLGGPAEVGSRLRPGKYKTPDAAGTWVRHCLDATKKDKFDWLDYVRMFKGAQSLGRHAAKHAFDEVTGYHPSTPKSIEDQFKETMRNIEQGQDALKAQYEKMADLKNQMDGGW